MKNNHFDLASMKPLWNEPKKVESIMAAHGTMKDSGGSEKGIFLYTEKSVVNGDNGSICFTYQPGTLFRSVTDQYLVLANQAGNNKLIFIDKFSGEKREEITIDNLPQKIKGLYGCTVLFENDSILCLSVKLLSLKGKIPGYDSRLLLIRKSDFTVRDISMGSNVNDFGIRIRPEENLVFIPGIRKVGSFRLPQ
ncbi:MAG: hypothetical protein C0403_05430 [Desulfobacterium sp.]|nr:hypothetical protein [Desulfobacterium sp.]